MLRCISLVLVFCCFWANAAPVREDTVTLPFGDIRGRLNEYAREFLGIPYATNDRFEPPALWAQPYPGGSLDATGALRSVCFQAFSADYPMSEDCLQLNIYTPRTAKMKGGSVPVLLWIHGGGLIEGSAHESAYNGSLTVDTQNVVVVAINYRLNMFGFSTWRKSDGSLLSNNGFRDQVAGMKWVQRHVAAFGGDPKRVTIVGESAGGQSVAVQLVSPLSKGLFAGAISESGDTTCNSPLDERMQVTKVVAANVSCADLACAQQADASELVAAITATGSDMFGAVIDGDVLPLSTVEMAAHGSFNRVPYMLGNNAEEASLFIALGDPHNDYITATQARCVFSELAGALDDGGDEAAVVARLRALYPVVEGQNNRPVVSILLSDVLFHCGNRRFASALAAAGSPPWMYSFKRAPACPLLPIPGAAHAFEIPFVFQTVVGLDAAQNCTAPPEDVELSRQMASLWGHFAHTGRQVASWEKYTTPKEQVAKLDIGLNPEALDMEGGYRRAHCDVINALGLKMEALSFNKVGNLAQVCKQGLQM